MKKKRKSSLPQAQTIEKKHCPGSAAADSVHSLFPHYKAKFPIDLWQNKILPYLDYKSQLTFRLVSKSFYTLPNLQPVNIALQRVASAHGYSIDPQVFNRLTLRRGVNTDATTWQQLTTCLRQIAAGKTESFSANLHKVWQIAQIKHHAELSNLHPVIMSLMIEYVFRHIMNIKSGGEKFLDTDEAMTFLNAIDNNDLTTQQQNQLRCIQAGLQLWAYYAGNDKQVIDGVSEILNLPIREYFSSATDTEIIRQLYPIIFSLQHYREGTTLDALLALGCDQATQKGPGVA